jgi:hypothetical protein
MALPFENSSKYSLAQGTHLGFLWEVMRDPRGYRWGYICVNSSHPWYRIHTDEFPLSRQYPIVGSVHQGLTFSKPGKIAPGEPAEWWLGFACNYTGDRYDPELADPEWQSVARGRKAVFPQWEIRSQAYVESECRALCEQAFAVIYDRVFLAC